jgi:hypothetical protein
MKTYSGSGGVSPRFSTSALDGGECSASRPGRFIRKKRAPGTHCIRGWVGPRAGQKCSRLQPELEPPIIQPVAQRCTTELFCPVHTSSDP